jgi:hypothetical protein
MQSLDAPASSAVPNQFRYQFWGQEPGSLMHRHRRLLTYSVWLITRKLQQVVTHWNAILFQLVYGWTIYRPVCLFPYITLQSELQTQWSLQTRLLTYSIKLWENHDLTMLPVITHIYSCGQIYASSVVYFSNSASGIELKLNGYVTQAFRENIPLAFYHTDSCCLVHFSIKYILRPVTKSFTVWVTHLGTVSYQCLNGVVLCRRWGISRIHSKKIVIRSPPSQI